MGGRIRLVARTSPDRRCVYCRGGAGALETCEGCGALTHPECREELGRCPTLGCREDARPRPAAEHVHVTPALLRPLYVTAAGHAALLLVTGATVFGWTQRLASAGWSLDGLTLGELVFGGTVACVTALVLTFSLPWLLSFPVRLARLDRLRRAPRPRRAAVHVEQVGTGEQVELQLVVTPADTRRPLTFRLHTGSLLPGWLRGLRPQDVTIYGDGDDPLLLELADGRMALLFQG